MHTYEQLDVDIGPSVEHDYDVTNHGPYDVGHLVVSLLNCAESLQILKSSPVLW